MKKDQNGKIDLRTTIQELAASGEITPQDCKHLFEIGEVAPSAEGCQKCLAMGDEWVYLRVCLVCGHVGCCDNSKNKHATGHFKETGHAIIASYEEGEAWLWCYADEVMYEM